MAGSFSLAASLDPAPARAAEAETGCKRRKRRAKHLERLASVVPANQITHTSEKVALKQGLQLRVFTSMTEAIRWLAHPAQQPMPAR
jgi:hypothetical protein